MDQADTYGDIPYFNAGRAFLDGSEFFYSNYDDDAAIYADLEQELRQATAALDPNGDYVSADLFYGSNGSIKTTTATAQVEQWKKLGNSLLLRLGMRYSKLNPAKAAAIVSEAFNGGVMTYNDDNVILKFDGTAFINDANNNLVNNNPYFYYAAEPFVNQLKSTNDPRRPFIVATYANPANPLEDPNPDTDRQRLASTPKLIPAIVFGVVTVLMPFFIMQPAFGLGVAASKTPNPMQSRLRSLMNHTAFGIGLYLFGLLLNWLL